MPEQSIDIKDFHWLMDMLQTIDVGLVVIDHDYKIQVWNGFMANHSGLSADKTMEKNLFELFKEIPERWFRRKAESVFVLKNRAFTTWEQRPYLFNFKNYRPITGPAEFMYQNITLIPLASLTGEVGHVGVIIYDVTDIAVSKQELQGANAQLETMSRTDQLTKLNNRGYWEERLESEFMRYKRTKQPCALMMFDIDHFKKVNDTYGHQMGDEVIRITARTFEQCLRKTDIPGRYGGEEFGGILLDTGAGGGLLVAERFRQEIEALVVKYEGRELSYTISIGISELAEDIDDYKQWLERADQALYECKRNGRNQSCVFSEKILKSAQA